MLYLLQLLLQIKLSLLNHQKDTRRGLASNRIKCLGLMYVACQLDPVVRLAVNPCAQPPLSEQQISEHGDLSYEPVHTIPYTGNRAERYWAGGVE